MPALAAVPKVLKIIYRQSVGIDTDVLNIVHFQYPSTAPTNADLDELADDLVTAWSTNMAVHQHASVQLTSVEIIDLTSATAALGTSSTTANLGSLGGAVLPAAASLVIKASIARRYRGGHPRSYLSVGDGSQLNNANLWGTSFANAVSASWLAQMNTPIAEVWTGGGAGTPVNVSYFSGFTNHTYPSGRVRPIPNQRVTPLIDVITGYSPNYKMASQRRRNLQSA